MLLLLLSALIYLSMDFICICYCLAQVVCVCVWLSTLLIEFIRISSVPIYLMLTLALNLSSAVASIYIEIFPSNSVRLFLYVAYKTVHFTPHVSFILGTIYCTFIHGCCCCLCSFRLLRSDVQMSIRKQQKKKKVPRKKNICISYAYVCYNTHTQRVESMQESKASEQESERKKEEECISVADTHV